MSSRAGKGKKGATDSAGAGRAAADEQGTVPDAAIEKAKSGVVQWSGRADETVRAMEQVQSMLRLLAARNEKDHRELQRLRIEAGFVAAMQMGELKAYREAAATGVMANAAGKKHTGAEKGARGNRVSSAGAGRKTGGKGPRTSLQTEESAQDANTTAADGEQGSPTKISITALDERKRQKIRQSLMAIYMSNPSTPPPKRSSLRSLTSKTPSVELHHITELKSVTASPTPPPQLLQQNVAAAQTTPLGSPIHADDAAAARPAEKQPQTSAGSQAVAAATDGANTSSTTTGGSPGAGTSVSSLALGAGDLRRPKEVPQTVWDELLNLRSLRILIEAHVERTDAAVITQVEKLAVLQEQLMVARYGMKTAFNTYVRAGGLKEDAPAAAAGPAMGSRPGSRSVSSKGRDAAAVHSSRAG